MFYSQLKHGLHGEGRPQAAVNFVSGCVAAAAATMLTQPADVVRTQMQLGLAGRASALGALTSILTQQGAGALMTGAGVAQQQLLSLVHSVAQGSRGDGAPPVTASARVLPGHAQCRAGVGPRFLKRTAQTALVWTLYEELMPRLSRVLTRSLADAGAAGGHQQQEQQQQGPPVAPSGLSAFVQPLVGPPKR